MKTLPQRHGGTEIKKCLPDVLSFLYFPFRICLLPVYMPLSLNFISD